jgi:hypothetical protein
MKLDLLFDFYNRGNTLAAANTKSCQPITGSRAFHFM